MVGLEDSYPKKITVEVSREVIEDLISAINTTWSEGMGGGVEGDRWVIEMRKLFGFEKQYWEDFAERSIKEHGNKT